MMSVVLNPFWTLEDQVQELLQVGHLEVPRGVLDRVVSLIQVQDLISGIDDWVAGVAWDKETNFKIFYFVTKYLKSVNLTNFSSLIPFVRVTNLLQFFIDLISLMRIAWFLPVKLYPTNTLESMSKNITCVLK